MADVGLTLLINRRHVIPDKLLELALMGPVNANLYYSIVSVQCNKIKNQTFANDVSGWICTLGSHCSGLRDGGSNTLYDT